MKLLSFVLLFILSSCQSVEVEPTLPQTAPSQESAQSPPEEKEETQLPSYPELEKANLTLKSILEEPFSGQPLLQKSEKGTYEGKLKSDLFEGKGILTWSKNEFFKGDFKKGNMEGNGIFQKPFAFSAYPTPRNLVIDGKIKSNQFTGKATYLVSASETEVPTPKSNFFQFEGEFKQNIPQSGKLKFQIKEGVEELKISVSKEINKPYVYKGEIEFKKEKHKTVYKGEFNQDLIPHGKAVHTTPEETYEGNFTNGIRNGTGSVKRMDGTYDNGTWENQIFIKGKTKRQYGEGMYEGDFLKDSPHGKGKLSYNGGDFYEGIFQEGAFEGQGKLKEENKISTGLFKEGKLFKGTISEDGFVRYSVNNFESGDSPQYIARVKREEAEEQARERREKAAVRAKCNALINYVRPRFDCGSYCFERSVYRNGLIASLLGFCINYYCPSEVGVCSEFSY